jgi:hypothetical protein
MGEPFLLAACRCRRAVPVLSGERVRGGRFTATCQAGLGLLVGSTSVYRVAATLGDLVFEVDRGVAVKSSTTTVPIVAVGQVVSLCRPSRRRLVSRWWVVLRARLAFSQRFDGPVWAGTAADPPRRSRRSRCARPRCWGLDTNPSLSDTPGIGDDGTVRWVMPGSTPITTSGRVLGRSARRTPWVNEQNQRPASPRTVAVKMRARPCSTRRASVRVDSWVLIAGDPG